MFLMACKVYEHLFVMDWNNNCVDKYVKKLIIIYVYYENKAENVLIFSFLFCKMKNKLILQRVNAFVRCKYNNS